MVVVPRADSALCQRIAFERARPTAQHVPFLVGRGHAHPYPEMSEHHAPICSSTRWTRSGLGADVRSGPSDSLLGHTTMTSSTPSRASKSLPFLV